MSVINPSICLQLEITSPTDIISSNGVTADGNEFYIISFKVQQPQTLQSTDDGNVREYDSKDVRKGDWIAGYLGGMSWMVTEVIYPENRPELNNPEVLTVKIEDINNYCKKIAPRGIGGEPGSTTTQYLLFRLNSDGLPDIFPLYTFYYSQASIGLVSDITAQFANRNLSHQYVNVYQPNNSFNMGDTIWFDITSGEYKKFDI